MIHEHHQVEEEVFFLEINEIVLVPGLMDANVDEHKLFHAGLTELQTYLERLKRGDEELDGVKLKGIIDGFMPTLRDHLENEIGTLVGLAKYADKLDWATWFKSKTDQLIKKSFSDSAFRVRLTPYPKGI